MNSRKKWILNNPEKDKESKRLYKERNREKVRIANRLYDIMNPDKVRAKVLKRRNTTIEEFDKMLLSQNGKCKICGTSNPGKGRKHLVVDHCHITNKIRGLLCSKCNVGLGALGDNLEQLKKAFDYLKEFQAVYSIPSELNNL